MSLRKPVLRAPLSEDDHDCHLLISEEMFVLRQELRM